MDYHPGVDEFRALLRAQLTERGALARLSEASDISSHVIGRWRDGIGRPTDTNLKKLAPALGRSYEDLAKMCGYLPGEVSEPDEAEVSASKFVGALRGVPRQFWASVVDASVALANAYAEATGSPQGPVSATPVPPVSKSRRPTNKRSRGGGADLANSSHPALALLGLR